MHNQRRRNATLIDWLGEHEHKIFLTVTLKKSIVSPGDFFMRPFWLTDAQVIGIGKFLRNRITRRLVGRRGRWSFLTFKEVGSFDRRSHLHILFDNPNNVPFEVIKRMIQSIIFDGENPWLREQWDIQEISNQNRLLTYTLKTGNYAFLPEASFLPSAELL